MCPVIFFIYTQILGFLGSAHRPTFIFLFIKLSINFHVLAMERVDKIMPKIALLLYDHVASTQDHVPSLFS